MFNALADLASHRPGRVVLVALLVAAAAGVFGSSVADRLIPFSADDPATDSVRATKKLQRATRLDPTIGLIALVDLRKGIHSKESRMKVARVARVIRGNKAIGRVATRYNSGNKALVSRDGRSSYIAAYFRPLPEKKQQSAGEQLQQQLSSESGVRLGGRVIASAQVNDTASADLARAEMFAFPILFLLSFVFFRGLVAALLPPLVGGLAIIGTFLALRVASELTSVSLFALNLITGLGLGLAIDYSLFIVSRYREELVRNGPGREALRRTMNTAGRTVLFSSLTVAAALASLLVFPQNFLYSMGLGGMLVTLVAASVALVVLPSVLSLLGKRVNALTPRRLQSAADNDARPASSGGWYRLSRFVMQRPGRIAVAAATPLIVLGIPFLGIKFTSVDASVLPKSVSARQVDDVLKRDFPKNRTSPIYLTIGAARGRGIDSYVAKVRNLDGVTAVSPPRKLARRLWAVDVISKFGGLSEDGQDLVHEVRSLPTNLDVKVGGETAALIDQKSSLGDHLPLAVAIVAIATFIVLFLMTGSVVLPIKASIMNLLTLSAAFGILVLIFQDGRLEGVLGYTSQGALERTQPILLFALVFGLSTDYGVFLLSRIKEARDLGESNSESVAIGLERTGRIVTAAALLFFVAIGAFSTSRMIFVKELGVGTGLAVLIDATIVRALLVPALMKLLGSWNWWAPRPLRWLYRRLRSA